MTLVLELKRCVVSDFGAAWFRISAPDGSWLLALWICDLVCFIYTCFKGNLVATSSSSSRVCVGFARANCAPGGTTKARY